MDIHMKTKPFKFAADPKVWADSREINEAEKSF